MKTTVENLEGNSRKVTIEIEADEVTSRINKQYKDFAHRYNFPGFRKGKAPRPIVDSVLGANAVVATVTDDILSKVTPVAIDEQGLVTIGQAEFEESEELVESGKPFVYSVTVDVRPELELTSYDPVKVELPSTEATEEEVDAQVEELRNYYYDFEDCPANTKVKKDSFVDISLKATNAAGEEIESLHSESRLYELGMGLFPTEFDEALVGLKKGEAATVTIDPSSPSMMTQSLGDDADKVTFDVEVKQVKKRIIPEVTDEWVKEKAGFENVAELRERMASQIKAQKESTLPTIRENEALFELQGRLIGEVPQSILEAQESELLQNFFMQLQQSGMSFDMFLMQRGMDPASFKEDLKLQAKDVAMQDLALDAWARHAGMQVSDEEIAEEFVKSGAEDPVALEAEWRESGRISPLRAAIMRSNAIKEIVDSLEVTELAAGEKLRSVREHERMLEEAVKEAEEAEKAAIKDDKTETKEPDTDSKEDNSESE